MTQLYLTMPQPGETISEGTIVSWLAKVGDTLTEGQNLAELETEKAVFEYESPFEGTLVKIIHQEGERVKVAAPIAIMEVPAEKAEIYQMMGIANTVDGDAPSADANTSSPEPSPAATKPAQVSPQQNTKSPIKMSPLIRKLAKEHGLNDSVLQSLADDKGRITKTAIENYISKKPSAPQSRATTQSHHNADVSITPCSAIRMRIAENMSLSKSKIPHAHTSLSIDMTGIVALKKQGSQALMTLIKPALVKAIEKCPLVNSSYDDAPSVHQIKTFHKINLGMAVGSEHGLIIPVIHDIASQSAEEFDKNLKDKINKAQNKKLMPHDLSGATIIFNNFGFFGLTRGVQVIQYPMAAIIGMGALERRVVPIDDTDELTIKTMSEFTLSFDHRLIDGREAGLFLNALKSEIESLS